MPAPASLDPVIGISPSVDSVDLIAGALSWRNDVARVTDCFTCVTDSASTRLRADLAKVCKEPDFAVRRRSGKPRERSLSEGRQ